jgi:hypothetical protein
MPFRILRAALIALIFFTLALDQKSAAAGEVRTIDSESNVSFTDPFGQSWRRWIVIQEIEERFLLLVVEAPASSLDDSLTSQIVVERKYFPKAARQELLQSALHFQNLKDLPLRAPEHYRQQSLLTAKSSRPLWTTSAKSWTEQDEADFSKWYTANLNREYFKGEGFDVDCADFTLLVRWAYAHDHKLPVANTLSGSGKLFGHFSGRADWDLLPDAPSWRNSKRFKAAAKHLLSSTYTKSIIRDLYPIELSKKYITAGSVYLNIRGGNHHAELIHKVGMQAFCPRSECISTLFGNLPARDIVFEGLPRLTSLKEGEGGFLRWRWPEFNSGRWGLRAAKKMPGYSLAQFSKPTLDPSAFEEFVQAEMGLVITPVDRAQSRARGLWNALMYRRHNTADGYFHCHFQYCDPKGTMYDDFSTPSKDRRFREVRDMFLAQLKQIPSNDIYLNELIQSLKEPLFVGHEISTYDYVFNVNGVSDAMSSDPTVSYAARWGLAETADNELLLANSLFMMAYFDRYRTVQKAINECAPESRPLRCNPRSPEIVKLGTHRFDRSLNLFKQRIDAALPQALPASVAIAEKVALQIILFPGCPWSDKETYCYSYDYLFSNRGLIGKMTSEPTDPWHQRMGLPN